VLIGGVRCGRIAFVMFSVSAASRSTSVINSSAQTVGVSGQMSTATLPASDNVMQKAQMNGGELNGCHTDVTNCAAAAADKQGSNAGLTLKAPQIKVVCQVVCLA